MKKIITLFIIGFFFTACSDETQDCCTNIDIGISIRYLNAAGENLFEIPDGIEESEITIYHKIDGEWERYFKGNLDYPKGINKVGREDGTYLVIFPSTTLVENNFSETKIEFSSTDADILKTEIDKSNANEIVTRVWYNDELKWEAYETERMFDIIK